MLRSLRLCSTALALLALAGCGQETARSSAVELTLLVDPQVPAPVVAQVASLLVEVRGGELLTFTVAPEGLAARQKLLVLRPSVAPATLDIAVGGLTASGARVLSGKATGVAVLEGATSQVTVTLAQGATPPDMATAPDMAAAPDLATPDLATPDLATPDLAAPDLATPDLATPDLITEDRRPAPDGTILDLARPDLAGHCGNKRTDGAETDVDCGGDCPPCVDGKKCQVNGDCQVGLACVRGACGLKLTYSSLADPDDPSLYVDVAIDPRTPTILYAVDAGGTVGRSADRGGSWTAMCKVTSGPAGQWAGIDSAATTRLMVSQGPDGRAYVAALNGLFRVDGLGGGNCPAIGSPIAPLYSSAVGSSVGLAPSGALYAWQYVPGGAGKLYRSTDGNNWIAITHNLTTAGAWGWIAIDPFNESHVLVQINSGGTANGLYAASDGVTFAKVSSTITGAQVAARFDPRNKGWAFANGGNGVTDGFFSSDGAMTFVQSGAHAMAGDWAIDPSSGNAYRLTQPATRRVVERTAGLTAPAWGPLPTTFATSGGSIPDRVDASGNVVAVISGARLFVSADAGGTFVQVGGNKPPPVVALSSLEPTADGKALWAGAADWGAHTSTDGVTWTQRYMPTRRLPSGHAYVQPFPADARRIVVWPHTENSTYDNNLVLTHDGFSTAREGTVNLSSWGSILALSPTDPSTIYYLGDNGGSLVSRDGGLSFSALAKPFPTVSLWNPADAIVRPDDPFAVWVSVATSSKAQVLEYNAKTTLVTDHTAKVGAGIGNEAPAGMEIYQANAAWRLRLISASGWVGYSDDLLSTFRSVTGAQGGLPSCGGWARSQRQISSLASDRNTVVTYCPGSAPVHLSRDGGATWTALGGSAWTSYSCQVSGAAPIGNRVAVACSNRPLVLLPY